MFRLIRLGQGPGLRPYLCNATCREPSFMARSIRRSYISESPFKAPQHELNRKLFTDHQTSNSRLKLFESGEESALWRSDQATEVGAMQRGTLEARDLAYPTVYRAQSLLTAKDPIFKVSVVDPKGEVTNMFKQKSALMEELRLQSRDIRVVELANRGPTILVRDNAMLVAVPPLQAIIQAESVILFNADSSVVQNFRDQLVHRLGAEKDESSGEHVQPFEFEVLEGLLIHVVDRYANILNRITPNTVNLLGRLTDIRGPIDQSQLKQLLYENKRLTAFESDIVELRSVLEELLDSDEDMAAMYLTDFAATGKERDISDHDEAEMLLESYFRSLEDLRAEVSRLKANIRDTENIININLHSQRNNMMRLDLQLQMGTFSVAFCGLVAAFFGMNLESGLEENMNAFYSISGATFIGVGVIFARLWFAGRRRRIW